MVFDWFVEDEVSRYDNGKDDTGLGVTPKKVGKIFHQTQLGNAF